MMSRSQTLLVCRLLGTCPLVAWLTFVYPDEVAPHLRTASLIENHADPLGPRDGYLQQQRNEAPSVGAVARQSHGDILDEANKYTFPFDESRSDRGISIVPKNAIAFCFTYRRKNAARNTHQGIADSRARTQPLMFTGACCR